MNGTPAGPSGGRLAVAIALLWLAGVAFYVAFEGGSFLQGGGSGPQYIKQILAELTRRTAQEEGT